MFWNTVGTFVVGSGHKVVCFGKKFVFLILFYISVHAFRLERLEESLRDEDMSEATKTEKRLQHAVKETEFLRLRRSRLGVDDFDPIKVIGRGAFGEVSSILTNISIHSSNCLQIEGWASTRLVNSSKLSISQQKSQISWGNHIILH